jgi:hypothetical protein
LSSHCCFMPGTTAAASHPRCFEGPRPPSKPLCPSTLGDAPLDASVVSPFYGTPASSIDSRTISPSASPVAPAIHPAFGKPPGFGSDHSPSRLHGPCNRIASCAPAHSDPFGSRSPPPPPVLHESPDFSGYIWLRVPLSSFLFVLLPTPSNNPRAMLGLEPRPSGHEPDKLTFAQHCNAFSETPSNSHLPT